MGNAWKWDLILLDIQNIFIMAGLEFYYKVKSEERISFLPGKLIDMGTPGGEYSLIWAI